jgi:hypothetical protein
VNHPIAQTRNGIEVYVDLIHSEAAKHIAKQPHLLGFVEEMLRKTSCRGPKVVIEHDMGRVIGYNFVVSTSETDNIFYALNLHDDIYARFVKNGKPTTTQYLTAVLHRSEDGKSYELQDAWIGRLSPPRPGSVNESPDSRPYWANHAFVFDSQSLQLRTVTKVCPY